MGLISLSDHKRLPVKDIFFENCIFLCGPAIDDRGRKLREIVSVGQNLSVIEILFDVDDYSLSLNDEVFPVRESSISIAEVVSRFNYDKVLIDLTTLGFVELLLILKWFRSIEFDLLSALYAEPESYKSRIDYMSDFGRHEFDLTSHSCGFRAIPGFSKALSTDDKSTLVAILGFERSRLGQLLQLDEGAYINNIIPVFGTPSFKVGWDKHCFFQNVESLKDGCTSPSFVSAYSALDMVERLEYIKGSFPDDQLTIAPFGTKPLSLGAAVFLINNPEVTLKYDHPIKKEERSGGLGRVHIFSIVKV